jgi:hypothetical protein
MTGVAEAVIPDRASWKMDGWFSGRFKLVDESGRDWGRFETSAFATWLASAWFGTDHWRIERPRLLKAVITGPREIEWDGRLLKIEGEAAYEWSSPRWLLDGEACVEFDSHGPIMGLIVRAAAEVKVLKPVEPRHAGLLLCFGLYLVLREEAG